MRPLAAAAEEIMAFSPARGMPATGRRLAPWSGPLDHIADRRSDEAASRHEKTWSAEARSGNGVQMRNASASSGGPAPSPRRPPLAPWCAPCLVASSNGCVMDTRGGIEPLAAWFAAMRPPCGSPLARADGAPSGNRTRIPGSTIRCPGRWTMGADGCSGRTRTCICRLMRPSWDLSRVLSEEFATAAAGPAWHMQGAGCAGLAELAQAFRNAANAGRGQGRGGEFFGQDTRHAAKKMLPVGDTDGPECQSRRLPGLRRQGAVRPCGNRR